MSEMIPEKTLRRVRNLLGKAERTENEHEAEAYNAQAQKLISEYGIEAAMLDAGRDPRDRPGVERRRVVVDAPYSRDKVSLLDAVARNMGCKVVMLGAPVCGRQLVELFGFPADTARVELVYTSLLVQATARVVHVCPTNPDENVGAYRRAWWMGFSSAIHHRIKEQEQAATRAAEARGRATDRQRDSGQLISVALVLVERGNLVDAAVGEAHPKMRTGRKRSLSSGAGLRAGHRAGHEADMGDRGYVGTGSQGKISGG